MAIKPVSGEIKSQDINDNLSYLDNKLSQVNGGPLGVLKSENELNQKYPNGANGFFIINGHMYFWEGNKWVDKGVYQAVGLSNGSVTTEILAEKAVAQKNIAFNPYNIVKYTRANFNTDLISYDENACLTITGNLTGQEIHNYQIQINKSNEKVNYCSIKFLPQQTSDSARVYVGNNQNDIIVANFVGIGSGNPRIDYYRMLEGILIPNVFPSTTIEISKEDYFKGFSITLNVTGEYLLTYFQGLLVSVNKLTSYFVGDINVSGIALRGTLEARSHIKEAITVKHSGPYMFFSVDDTIGILKDLTENASKYTSIFDNPKLYFFKMLKDKYDIVVSFWLFLEDELGWNISNMSVKYRAEFAKHSTWLRFGLHSKNMLTNYTSASGQELLSDYTECLNQIRRFATDANIDPIPRFQNFSASKESLVFLKNKDVVFEGIHTADDNRSINAGLSGIELDIVQNVDDYYHVTNDIFYIRSEKRLDNLGSEKTIKLLDDMYYDVNNNRVYNMFIHENGLGGNGTKTAIEAAAKWAFDKRIRFDFPQNNIPKI